MYVPKVRTTTTMCVYSSRHYERITANFDLWFRITEASGKLRCVFGLPVLSDFCHFENYELVALKKVSTLPKLHMYNIRTYSD